MVLPRKGKDSSWGFTLTHLYFSLHLSIAMPGGGSRGGTCQSFPLIPLFLPACTLTSGACGTHQITPTGKKISFKRLHIYRMSTPIRYSLVTWQLLSTCTHSSHHPGTFLLPPRQDSEWDVPCSKCQHNWAP